MTLVDAAPTPVLTRVHAIDGLRAVAALAVFVFHLTWRSPVLHDAARPVTGHLDLGVEIFFMISGFLIFGPFAKALARNEAFPSMLAYAARRAIRIWPAYLVVLTTITVLAIADFDGTRGFLKHATLTYLYFDDKGGKGLALAWTLVVELSFYAFVPVAAYVIARTGRRLVGACVALVAVGAFMQRVVAYDLETEMWIRILPPRLLMLGMGMLLAAIYHQGERTGTLGRSLRRAAGRPMALLLIALAAFALLMVLVPAGTDVGDSGSGRFTKELLQTLMATCVVLPIMLPAGDGGRWDRLLGHRVTTYLGTISYGLYLWHIPVLHLFRTQVTNENALIAAAGWTAGLALSLALAAASWHLVEKPLMGAVARRLRPARSKVSA